MYQLYDFFREELHFLRRYCAKFLYERALYSGEVPWSELPDLYVSLLGKATGFEYNAAHPPPDL